MGNYLFVINPNSNAYLPELNKTMNIVHQEGHSYARRSGINKYYIK